MPSYDFRNKDTGEITTLTMKIAEKEQYLKDNPNMESYFGDTLPQLIDPVRLGVRKPDSGFKEVLSRIHEKTPGSRLNKFANF